MKKKIWKTFLGNFFFGKIFFGNKSFGKKNFGKFFWKIFFWKIFFLEKKNLEKNILEKKICIGPIIRIGRETQCLPYAGFFSYYTKHFKIWQNCFHCFFPLWILSSVVWQFSVIYLHFKKQVGGKKMVWFWMVCIYFRFL